MIRTVLAMMLAVMASPAWAAFSSDRLTVVAEGSGPDVILVPGLTSSPAAWRSSTPKVPGYRYHYVQVKGFAGTAPEGNSKGGLVAGVADEVARYVREERLAKSAIVGHSMGGTVAMMVAARHPGAVSRIMVVDMMPFMGAMYGPAMTSASVAPIADNMATQMKASNEADRLKATTAMTDSMVANAARRGEVLKSAMDSDQAVVAETFREITVTDLRSELGAIKVPATVLYVTPKGAPLTDAQIDGFYVASYANLAGAKLVRIPDSAHFIMYDNPARFEAELKAFLAR